MAELIAEHIKPRSTTIFRLFNGIIEARRETYKTFQRIVANNPDPDIEKCNTGHKYWIDDLTQAFNVLGGDAWLAEQQGTSEVPEKTRRRSSFPMRFQVSVSTRQPMKLVKKVQIRRAKPKTSMKVVIIELVGLPQLRGRRRNTLPRRRRRVDACERQSQRQKLRLQVRAWTTFHWKAIVLSKTKPA